MTPADWSRVRKIFDDAAARPVGERSAFLDAACAGRPDLREEVASLLAAHETAGDFIEAPAYEIAAHLLVDEVPALAGRSIGPYLIRDEIGRGGMGVVYLADDTRLSRRVALKAIAAGLGADAGRRERMRQEARAAAALSHPGIATVFALEEIDGELYLACEYAPGPTLRALIEAGPLPMAQVVDIAAQLARALAAAHAQGVVHRDLKPDNIVRNSAGVIKVLDFGIARLENDSGSRLTNDGGALGTPAYMSPEQIRGEPVDFRSDLFSFGLIVRELAGANLPDQAAGLARIVATCLRDRPGDRYQSTHALVAELEQLERRTAPFTQAPAASSARWWWECHQVATSAVYILMAYPVWRARAWLPKPWHALFFVLILSAAATATTVRLHLVFTARSFPLELPHQLARAVPWSWWADAAFSAVLLIGALAIADEHSEVAALFLSVAIAAGIASWLIEPATTRAAFRDQTRRS